MASCNQILTKKLLWNRFSNDSNSLGENQGLAITQSEQNPNGTDSGLNPHSFGKGTNNTVTTKENSEKVSDKGTLHKTFFYKDSQGKSIPYKNKPNILEKRSVDGSTTISPAEEQQPADTENISALDQSSNGKVTNNSEKSYDKSKKLDFLYYRLQADKL